MATQVKLYIEPEGEIRRFNLDAGSTFDVLEQRVKSLVGRENYRMFWQDSEGDFVVCGSDDELKEARQSQNSQDPLRIFIRDAPRKTSQGTEGGKKGSSLLHRHVTCDACNGEISGTRYKCLECEDFDLCEKCEADGKHPEHDMLAIRTPRTQEWKKVFVRGYGSREGHRGHGGRHHEGQGHCGFRSARGPCGGATGQFGPGFVPPFVKQMLGTLNPAFEKTVEMDVNLNRPVHEVIADVAKKVTDAMHAAHAAQKEAADAAAAASTEQPKPEPTADEKAAEEKKEQEVADLVTATVTQVADAVTMVAETVLQAVDAAGISQETGWTLLQAEPVDTEEKKEFENPVVDKQGQPQDGPTQQQPAEDRVENALRTLEDMGFKNEGNLLRRLLVNYNGDISRVLDSIK